MRCYTPFVLRKKDARREYFEMKQFRVVDLTYMAVCAALIAVCSWISIKFCEMKIVNQIIYNWLTINA